MNQSAGEGLCYDMRTVVTFVSSANDFCSAADEALRFLLPPHYAFYVLLVSFWQEYI